MPGSASQTRRAVLGRVASRPGPEARTGALPVVDESRTVPATMSGDLRDELRGLLAEAHGFLAWETELGGVGLRARPRTPEVRPAPEPATAAPARPVPSAAPPATPAPDAARLPIDEARRRLSLLAEEAAACTACRLHAQRTHSVFARGNPAADLVFVGEGPGFHEDQQGVPFVGPAGQLLDKMIAAMGYRPDDVYICNVVKCRPPENRTPEPDESRACGPFLVAQLEIVKPRAIVALGRCAAEGLSVMPPDGRGWRGRWASWKGVDVMPTYHPAYLLRSPEQKRVVWEDLQKVMAKLGVARRP